MSRDKTVERISWIDAIRGFAMLGIMIVNLPSINTLAGKEAKQYGFMTTSSDEIVGRFGMMVLNGKFYPIFALLFGLGMFIFMDSLKLKNLNPYKYMVKRLFFLFMLGAIHVFLVWWGDILLVYSIFGMVLLTCFNFSSKRLGVISLVLLLGVPILASLALLPGWNPIYHSSVLLKNLIPSAIHAIYGHGTFWDVSRQRLVDCALDFFPILSGKQDLQTFLITASYFSQIFGLFILGFWLGKTRFYLSIFENLGNINRVFWFCFIFSILPLVLLELTGPARLLCNTSLAISYFCGLIIIYHRSKIGKAILSFFVPVGRMSLTAYLSHTVSFSFLLYGYGLGWYGKVGPASLLWVSLVFYLGFNLFSHFWLTNFSQGPLEWALRSFVYGKSMKLLPSRSEEVLPSEPLVH